MKLKEFDYDLPKNLIAQKGISPRDHSRLLVLWRQNGKLEHKYFYDLPDYLEAGDLLVLNNSKVVPARLFGVKPTGGKIEVFLLAAAGNRNWRCLIGGKRRQVGLDLSFGRRLKGRIVEHLSDGTWLVRFNLAGKPFKEEAARIGRMPLPPYIRRTRALAEDKIRYQTVYAEAEKAGSVAAPTAGLHFTPQLLKRLQAKGVELAYLTLHVGLGTFAPVKTEQIEAHKMHEEKFEIDKIELAKIIKAKKERRRIIAVGTTSARVLESVWPRIQNSKFPPDSLLESKRAGKIKNYSGETGIYIYPGYRFKAVDALITNFHLPKSTLLMLVSAFAAGSANKTAGLKPVKKAYRTAIRKKYRFFSYGDAMLIL